MPVDGPVGGKAGPGGATPPVPGDDGPAGAVVAGGVPAGPPSIAQPGRAVPAGRSHRPSRLTGRPSRVDGRRRSRVRRWRGG